MGKLQNKRNAGRPADEEKMDRFALWFAIPKDQRVPATIGEWCERNDVAPSTAYRWRQDPDYRRKILAYRLELADDSMADIIKGLTTKAKDGELGQAKFLMELMGDFIPKSEMNVNHNMESGGSMDMNPEMIEFIAEEMLDHPSMVKMNSEDLIKVLSDVMLDGE